MLLYTSRTQCVPMACVLFQPSCDINCLGDEERNVLHNAAIAGHTDILELVVGYGVDMNADDTLSNNALHMIFSKMVGDPPNEILSPRITEVTLMRIFMVEPCLNCSGNGMG